MNNNSIIAAFTVGVDVNYSLIMRKEYHEDVLAELIKVSSSIEKDVQKICPNYSFGDLNINDGIIRCNDYVHGKKLFRNNDKKNISRINDQNYDDEINIDDIDDISSTDIVEMEVKQLERIPEMDNSMRESLSLDWIRYEAESLESMLWDRIQYLKKKSF